MYSQVLTSKYIWLHCVLLFLQRKYIRTKPACISQKNFHAGYKAWVEDLELANGLMEDCWQEILSEDATHPYNTHPLSYPPPPAVSDDDIHEEGEGLEGDSPNLIDLDPLNPEAYAFSVDL